MKIGILALTTGGKILGTQLQERLEGSVLLEKKDGVAATMTRHWPHFEGFVCIMATGIVVRAVGPLLKDKYTDPAVVVLDQHGKHVISLVSGHVGGGNELATRVAQLTGGVAVITTASDTLGLTAVDMWAREKGLVAARETLTRASTLLVNRGELNIFSEVGAGPLPTGLHSVFQYKEADVVISHRKYGDNVLQFYPKNLVVGIGCNRGTPCQEFEEAFDELFHDLGCSPHSVRNLSSIDLKSDEEGLLDFAEKKKWPLEFYGREEINEVTDTEISPAAMKAVGAIGVAEPTALLSAKSTQLLSRKRKWKNITMAVAKVNYTL